MQDSSSGDAIDIDGGVGLGGLAGPLSQQGNPEMNLGSPDAMNPQAVKRVHDMLSPPRSTPVVGTSVNTNGYADESTASKINMSNSGTAGATAGEDEDNKVFNGEVNTKIACLTCREKKLKCDKLLPVCSRCAKKGCPCIYVEHKKTGPKPNSVARVKKHDLSSSSNENSENENAAGSHINAHVGASVNGNGNGNDSIHMGGANANAQTLAKKMSVRWKRVKTADPYSTVFSQPDQLQQASPSQTQNSTRIPVLNFMNPSAHSTPASSSSNHYYGQPLVSSNTADLRNVDYNEGHKMNISGLPNINEPHRHPIPGSIPNSVNNINDNNDNTDLGHMINDNNNNAHESNNNNGEMNKNKSSNVDTNSNNNNNNNARMAYAGSLNSQIHQHTAKLKIPETFNTNLTNLTNKSFEEVIGLPHLNLTMQDIDKFHSFYFNSSTRIFKYSIQRYYNTFVKEPKSILHYSYMIWTMACFYLDEYEYMVEKMYKSALVQMNNYWESNRDSFHSDILTYLHALCLKSQFEFLSGREMRAALTVASSIRLTQMYGYDQIDLSPTTLGSPAIFFRSSSITSEKYESTNTLLQDDNLDPDIPLVEERRRVLWEVFAIDKWSSLVTGLPCALSVDSLSVIFTKLPSPTTFLPLNNDSEMSESENEQSSFYLHEAMQKLDNNQVLLDINSSSSKILLLTISENIIKWCKMFLNMVELETLKSQSSIESIRNKVDELVRNFESMHNNLLFFDLTTEPLMNIVITNTSTLLYQSVLIKFGSLFDLQFKENPTGANISENEIRLFKDILYEVSAMSEKLVSRFIKKSHIENHLKKAPVFIVFINSIKSLFQCIAFVYRFNKILHVDEERKKSLLDTINSCATVINGMSVKTPIVEKTKDIINNGQELLDHSAHMLSFFDSFFDSARSF